MLRIPRFSLVLCLVAQFLAACGADAVAPMGAPPPAGSGPGNPGPSGTPGPAPYLALGDSIAFGYSPLIAEGGDASRFVGYPELLGPMLGFAPMNLACTGETSGSFLSRSEPDNGCAEWRSHAPLHVPYPGAGVAQLDFAVALLRAHGDTALVTLAIGGNDLVLLRGRCGGDAACVAAGMPRLLGDLRSHLETIFSRLRDDAGYAGPIVALTYYAPNYGNLTEDASLIALNQVLADVARDWDAKVANGFDAFLRASLAQTGDACAAGLLVSMPGGGCDAHPSLDGHRALAQTVAQVLGPVGPRAN